MRTVIFKTGSWWTKPGQVCMADPMGEGGKWNTAFVKLTRSTAGTALVLPLWWRRRLVLYF